MATAKPQLCLFVTATILPFAILVLSSVKWISAKPKYRSSINLSLTYT